MKTVQAEAPGKIILVGEHAAVYGQPALAVPIHQLRAMATVSSSTVLGTRIHAADLHETYYLGKDYNGITQMVTLCLVRLGIGNPAIEIDIQSTIPIASGLGSGAAVSAALGKALHRYYHVDLPTAILNALVYEVEKTYHGTPSGIDNTVVCYEQPVFFVKGQPPQPFDSTGDFHFLVGDTGVSSPTKNVVSDVREAWIVETEKYNDLFVQIGTLGIQAREALSAGDDLRLGDILNINHKLLQALSVSSKELDVLVQTARENGAFGAKLSGGGRGGNMIALASEQQSQIIKEALIKAGAVNVIETIV